MKTTGNETGKIKVASLITIFGLVAFLAERQGPTAAKPVSSQTVTEPKPSSREVATVEKSSQALQNRPVLSYRSDEALESAMKEWLASGTEESRRNVMKSGQTDPVTYVKLARRLLREIPHEGVSQRSQILAMTIDVAESVNAGKYPKAAEFYSEVKLAALDEMAVPEFVRPSGLHTLTDMQKDSLIHRGDLIEKQGELLRPTAESKVVALHLTGRLPSKSDKQEVVTALSTAPMADFTRETLKMVAGKYSR